MEFLDKSKISYCDRCSGHDCSYCGGSKYYIRMANSIVYFKKELSNSSIKIDQIKRILNAILNVILFMFLLLGIFSLFYHAYDLINAQSNLFDTENWLGWKVLLFWISVLFDMFLFFRLNKKDILSDKVEKNKFEEDDDIELKNLYHKNIYDVLSFEVKNCIIDAWYISQKTFSSRISTQHLFLSLLKTDSVLIIFGRLGINKKIFEEKLLKIIENNKEVD